MGDINITELFEYATADTVSGLANAPFIPFVPGDAAKLQSYVKFRATTVGDFDIQDYRLRGFSALQEASDKSTCGYGLGPYGQTPYGCGLDAAAGPPPLPPDVTAITVGGRLSISGNVSVTQAPPPPPPPPPASIAGILGISSVWLFNEAYFTLGTTSSNFNDVAVPILLQPGARIVKVSTNAPTMSLGAGSTATLAVTVNGVDYPVLTFNDGQTGPAVSADLNIPLNTGDLMALHFTTTSMSPTVNFLGIIIAYLVP